MNIKENWRAANPYTKYPLIALFLWGFLGSGLGQVLFFVAISFLILSSILDIMDEGFCHVYNPASIKSFLNELNAGQPIRIVQNGEGYFHLEQRNGVFGFNLPIAGWDVPSNGFQTVEDAEYAARAIMEARFDPIRQLSSWVRTSVVTFIKKQMDRKETSKSVVKEIK